MVLMKTVIRNRLNRAKAVGIIIILTAYAPGVFKESFWSDDYPALMDTPGVVDHLLLEEFRKSLTQASSR